MKSPLKNTEPIKKKKVVAKLFLAGTRKFYDTDLWEVRVYKDGKLVSGMGYFYKTKRNAQKVADKINKGKGGVIY